jgi:predicted dehydrogenase
MERAGRVADGWVTASAANLSEIAEYAKIVQGAAAAAGRTPVRIVVRGVVRTGAEARTSSGKRMLLSGSYAQIREDVAGRARLWRHWRQGRNGVASRSGRMLRLGILGAARIAERALIIPTRESASVTVVAIATRDKARADTFALQHGIPTAYGSYESLLEDPSVDAVYIPLPNALHGSWTLRALEAGKHVLCEKPLTANAAEAERVVSAATSTGLVVMEAMHYRYHPLVQRMASIIAEGVIGTPRHVQCWTSWAIPDISDIRYLFELGGGALMDGGCYAVDCLRLLGLSEPTVTGALADPLGEGGSGEGRVDRAMAVRLSSSSGMTG